MSSYVLLSVEVICMCCFRPMPSYLTRFKVTLDIRTKFQNIFHFPLIRSHPNEDYGFICIRCNTLLNQFEEFRQAVTSARSIQHPEQQQQPPMPENIGGKLNQEMEQLIVSLPEEEPKKDVPLEFGAVPKDKIKRESFKSFKQPAVTSTPKSIDKAQKSSSSSSSDDSGKLVIDESGNQAQAIESSEEKDPEWYKGECAYCGEKMSFRDSLKHKHFFQCPFCAKPFLFQHLLDQHIEETHTEVTNKDADNDGEDEFVDVEGSSTDDEQESLQERWKNAYKSYAGN